MNSNDQLEYSKSNFKKIKTLKKISNITIKTTFLILNFLSKSKILQTLELIHVIK